MALEELPAEVEVVGVGRDDAGFGRLGVFAEAGLEVEPALEARRSCGGGESDCLGA